MSGGVVGLDDLRRLLASGHGLTAVTTVRPDGTVSATLVNVGVLAHPVSGEDVVGFVVRGDAVKLRRFRRQRHTTAIAHVAWEWVAVSGPLDMAGPDDRLDGLDPGTLPALLRAVYRAAGGSHDDWDTFDRVMAEERRAAVLVRPERVGGNLRS